MNDVAWLPSLLVLGVGLAIGLAAALKVRRKRKRSPAAGVEALKLRDLEARRDDLYRRLRSAELDAGDRESLELAAAHTLRELDQLAPGHSKKAPPPKAPDEPRREQSAPLPLGGRHPALVGFIAGMAVVLLVVTLVYLAMRDSGAAGTPAAANGSADPPHEESESLPAEVQREIEQLEAAAAAAPDDLLARKRLALGRLDAGLYFEAFRDAESILAARPEDPDGLFIHGVVRLSMGQAAEAVSLLDKVLVRYPEHLQAMIYRGLALAQIGERDQAISTWEMALDMAGGSHPDIEMLLQQAHAQEQQEVAAAAAPAPAAPVPPTTSLPPAQPSATPLRAGSETTVPGYHVTIELAPGRTVSPGGALFVFLRPGETGPPAAVRRILAPRFPVELTLGPDDTMMAGGSLPDQGTLVARLSATGRPTRGPDDLEASAVAAAGQSIRLVLGGS